MTELKPNTSSILVNINRLNLNSLFKGKYFQVDLESKIDDMLYKKKVPLEQSDSERLK